MSADPMWCKCTAAQADPRCLQPGHAERARGAYRVRVAEDTRFRTDSLESALEWASELALSAQAEVVDDSGVLARFDDCGNLTWLRGSLLQGNWRYQCTTAQLSEMMADPRLEHAYDLLLLEWADRRDAGVL